MDEELSRSPLCLIVPGLGNSGPEHWQTIWETDRKDCQRVGLGCWNDPIRNVWISRIDQAVSAAKAPVVLVAHSLGCLAVAWWASLLGEGVTGPVRGALLVAPPDVDRGCADGRLHRFAPSPRGPLPFPSVLVASRNDPYARFERSAEMAGNWLARLVDAGDAGHLNAESRLGAWSEGQTILDALIDDGAAHGSRDAGHAAQPLRMAPPIATVSPARLH